MTRVARRLLSLGAALVAALWFALAGAIPARAADDAFDVFDVVATLAPDGFVSVTETITLRFGSSSGRHGLERTLVTREPSGDQDAVYDVSGVTVSSPSGVSTQLNLTSVSEGRIEYLRIRVGDPERTISASTATYVLSYRIAGLVRTSGSYDELYWDLTGSSMPVIKKASARITVPGGAQDVFCSVAEPGTSSACDSAEVGTDKVAQFAHAPIPTGELMTVSVKIAPGLVSDNKPHLVENADEQARRLGTYALAGSTALAAMTPVAGWLYWRRRGRDRRFEGLPPGVLPARGQEVREVSDSRAVEVPVAFSPPRLSLAEAGLLLDGTHHVRHTTATLVGLAVNGAIRLRSEEPPEATLVDTRRAGDRPSSELLDALFETGDVSDLTARGSMAEADDRVKQAASAGSFSGHWFLRRPRASGGAANWSSGFFPVLVVGIVGTVFLGPVILLALPLLISVAITALVVNRKLQRGQRTGVGRALTDRVEGFRTYIATAEAEQLRFEEGEDIFSKYLPWAILFDLTDRWIRVCERLVELGRLSPVAPSWYYGTSWDLHHMAWQMDSMNHHVTEASAPVFSAPSSSDLGFGHSGSAFGGGGGFSGGGGGFSGGGGGGGGGGSW